MPIAAALAAAAAAREACARLRARRHEEAPAAEIRRAARVEKAAAAWERSYSKELRAIRRAAKPAPSPPEAGRVTPVRTVPIDEYLRLKAAARSLAALFGDDILTAFGVAFLREEGNTADADIVERYLDATRQFQQFGAEPGAF